MDDEGDMDKMWGKEEEKRLWRSLHLYLGTWWVLVPEMAKAGQGHVQSHQDQDAYQTSEGG